MTSLADIYGRDKLEGTFGPELEVEYKHSFNVVCPEGWTVKTDDSLRNFGIEFIAAKPFTRDELSKRINEVCKYAVTQKGYVPRCPRTSFHVHYNVSDMTLLEICNCIVAYWLLEDSITKHCGKQRQGNQYCLSSSISTAVIDTLQQSVERDTTFPFYTLKDNNRVRYAGQNLCSVPKLMSLENRVMNGDAENPEALLAWVNNLDKLYLYARTFKNPSDLCDMVFNNPVGFMINACDPGFMGYLDLDNVEQKLVLVSELAYETDWDKWGKSFKKKTKKEIKYINTPRGINLEQLVVDDWNPLLNPVPQQQVRAGMRAAYRTIANNDIEITFDEEMNSYLYTRHPDQDTVGLGVSYEDYCTLLFGSVELYENATGRKEDEYYSGLYYGRDY